MSGEPEVVHHRYRQLSFQQTVDLSYSSMLGNMKRMHQIQGWWLLAVANMLRHRRSYHMGLATYRMISFVKCNLATIAVASEKVPFYFTGGVCPSPWTGKSALCLFNHILVELLVYYHTS